MITRSFRRTGIFFRPVKPLAWLVLLAAIGYCIWAFIDIDSRSHSVSDTLINWVFNCLLVGAAYSLIGWLLSRGT